MVEDCTLWVPSNVDKSFVLLCKWSFTMLLHHGITNFTLETAIRYNMTHTRDNMFFSMNSFSQVMHNNCCQTPWNDPAPDWKITEDFFLSWAHWPFKFKFRTWINSAGSALTYMQLQGYKDFIQCRMHLSLQHIPKPLHTIKTY